MRELGGEGRWFLREAGWMERNFERCYYVSRQAVEHGVHIRVSKQIPIFTNMGSRNECKNRKLYQLPKNRIFRHIDPKCSPIHTFQNTPSIQSLVHNSSTQRTLHYTRIPPVRHSLGPVPKRHATKVGQAIAQGSLDRRRYGIRSQVT